MAETFRTGKGPIVVEVRNPYEVALDFTSPMAGLETLFDQLAITSSRSPEGTRVVLGSFTLADHKTGQYVLLKRNPN